MSASFREVHWALRNALGTREVLRELGFDESAVSVHLRNGVSVFVELATGNRRAFFDVGRYAEDLEQFEIDLQQAIGMWKDGELDAVDKARIVEETPAKKDINRFVQAIVVKGITVPPARIAKE